MSMIEKTAILSKVADTIGTTCKASFDYGTLFVTCTEDEARKVFHRLSKDCGIGKVLISKSKYSPEYAFDFTV